MAEVRGIEWPTILDRPDFYGSVVDYEWLAAWFCFGCSITPVWRGTGTVLIVVWDADGAPVSSEDVRQFRAAVAEWSPVNCVVTVVGSG